MRRSEQRVYFQRWPSSDAQGQSLANLRAVQCGGKILMIVSWPFTRSAAKVIASPRRMALSIMGSLTLKSSMASAQSTQGF